MKINNLKLKPSANMLWKELVYSEATYNEDAKTFYSESKKRIIATVKEVELTQDPVYKTSFYNDELYSAIDPRNADTAIKLYDASGNELKGYVYSLEKDYGAIVFNQVPSVIPVKARVVIYCGPLATGVLTTDGSTTMDEGYLPTKDLHVVTKKYLENELNSLQAGLYSLSSLTITQNKEPLRSLIKYSDNETLPVVFLDPEVGTVEIATNQFIIEQTFSEEETYISLILDGKPFYKTLVKDVIDGKSNTWQLVSSKNIFETDLTNTYWLNSYKLVLNNFDLILHMLQLISENPAVNLAIKVSQNTREYAANTVVGLDKYLTLVKNKPTIEWDNTNLLRLKTKYISGVPYLDSPEKNYPLDVNFTISNEFLHYYRPASFLEAGIIVNGEKEKQVEWGISTQHTPYLTKDYLDEYDFTKTIQLRHGISHIYFKVKDVIGKEIFYIEKEIDAKWSDGLEAYRVYTPAADSVNPKASEFGYWDSKRALNAFEPALIEGVYTLQDESALDRSAIAFKLDTTEHYSHLDLDIEHDGKMYIMSVGNTSWLDCEERVAPFEVPTTYHAPCKLGEGQSYTFGKVVYKSSVIVRIVGASRVKFNSISVR